MRDRVATVVHDRYQVVDPVCGLVLTMMHLRQAFQVAQIHAKACSKVEIYDCMAHSGQPRVWDSEGNIIEVEP